MLAPRRQSGRGDQTFRIVTVRGMTIDANEYKTVLDYLSKPLGLNNETNQSNASRAYK